MATKKIEAAPAAAPHQRIRVLRAVISFEIGEFSEDGRLLREEPAPMHPLRLCYPFHVTPEALQQVVHQLEEQLNQG